MVSAWTRLSLYLESAHTGPKRLKPAAFRTYFNEFEQKITNIINSAKIKPN